MQKLLYVTPHLSTGGAPQYLLKKLELIIDEYDVHVIEFQDFGIFRIQKDQIIDILKNPLITLQEDKYELMTHIKNIRPDIIHFEEMPELFDISEELTQLIYHPNRKYKIFETSQSTCSLINFAVRGFAVSLTTGSIGFPIIFPWPVGKR